MSNRTLADWMRAAFLQKDKASVTALIADAEAEQAPPNGNGKSDGDDEGSGDDKGQEGGGDKHASNIHIHVEHGAQDTVETRVAKLEDSVTKLVTSFDSMTKAIKDGELPPWLKKGDDGDGDDDKKEETADEGIEVPEGETGALSAEKLQEAEPELMDSLGSKKTGEMRMGDAAVVKAVAKLVKDVKARAEILSPGIKLQLDAKPGATTQKALCDARRTALTKAVATDAGRKAVGSFTASDIKAMSCDLTRTVFKDASERMAAINNTSQTGFFTGDDFEQQVKPLKGINARHKDFWEAQMGKPRLN